MRSRAEALHLLCHQRGVRMIEFVNIIYLINNIKKPIKTFLVLKLCLCIMSQSLNISTLLQNVFLLYILVTSGLDFVQILMVA